MEDRQKVITRNRELAWRINDELLRDQSHPYTGKWIGIANGQVVFVGNSWEEVETRLNEIEPDSFRTDIMEGRGVTEEEELATYGDAPEFD
jgi:hypothetical protein